MTLETDAIREQLAKELADTKALNAELEMLIAEVVVTMSHAETFILSTEKMHPTGVGLWLDLLARLRAHCEPAQECGNESSRLVGGE